MITLENLSYDIDGEILFSNISLSIFPSSIVKVRGNNGSGKTTFLRILANIQNQKSGTIFTNIEKIAYIGHNLAIKDDLTVIEQLEFWASITGDEVLIPAAIRYMKIEDIIEDYCYSLSSGNKQKVAIARLLVSDAKIWILDEVDNSLDTKNIELLKNLIISKSSNGGIIFYSSHTDNLPSSFTIDIGSQR
jgi:heme exporter protein A